MKKRIQTKTLAILPLLCIPATGWCAVENWYTYWSIGAAQPKHDSQTANTLDSLASQSGMSRSKTAIDALGFYWPTASGQSMYGVVAHGITDTVSGGSYSYSVSQSTLSFSNFRFFGREIGDGLFIRGDIGLASAGSTASTAYSTVSSTTKNGFGVLGGVGYGLPLSEETRILFSLNYLVNEIPGARFRALSFTLGGLW